MSPRARHRFQRVALLVIGFLLVVLGARQLAYAATGSRCTTDRHRLGYYEDHHEHRRHIRQHRQDHRREEIEMHIIVN